MSKIIINSELEVFDQNQDQFKQLESLIFKAENNLKNAYAPYSNFLVSCAIELDNGETVFGTNQENAAYPSGLCAERVALFHVGSNYPARKIKRMLIVAHSENVKIESPIFSCGACLQVMKESEDRNGSEYEIFLKIAGENQLLYKALGVKTFLPFSFGKDMLIKE